MRLSIVVQRVSVADSCDIFRNIFLAVFKIRCRKFDIFRDIHHILRFKSPCCNRGGADTDTACDKGLFGVVGNGVFIDRYMRFVYT